MSDNVSALAVVPSPDPSLLNNKDTVFLKHAQLSTLTELAETNVALHTTSNIASRNIAPWLLSEHTRKSAQLASITHDPAFVDQAATSSRAEIAEGQIAIHHPNQAVSEFGRWMTADHGAMNTALGAIAKSEGFSLPTAVTPDQQSDLANLPNVSDSTF